MKADVGPARMALRLLEKVRTGLCRPTISALDCCAADLGIAFAALQQLEISLSEKPAFDGARQELATEMNKARGELRILEELLAGTARFHARWHSVSGGDNGASNYTAAGQALAAKPAKSGLVMHG